MLGDKTVLTQVRIVTVDDSEPIRELLGSALSVDADLSVVGTATNGVEALRVIRELRPDVVVLDISMPLMDGIEVLKEIRKEDQSTKVIMFTCHDSASLSDFCRANGANYFLQKTEINKLVTICKEQIATERIKLTRTNFENCEAN